VNLRIFLPHKTTRLGVPLFVFIIIFIIYILIIILLSSYPLHIKNGLKSQNHIFTISHSGDFVDERPSHLVYVFLRSLILMPSMLYADACYGGKGMPPIGYRRHWNTPIGDIRTSDRRH
jgi:hypothetical protein